MNKIGPKLIVPAVLLSLAAAPVPAGKDLSRIRETVKTMSDALVEATLNADIETVMSYYADDAVSMPNFNEILEGKEAIRRYNEEMFAVGVQFQSFRFETLELWKSGDRVYETGTFDISLTLPGQSAPIRDRGKYMTVYLRQKGGGLLISREIWNTDMNPMTIAGSMQDRECTSLMEARNAIEGMVRELKQRAFVGLDGEWDDELSGYRVAGFAAGSYAQGAGVKVGDVLVAVNGIPLADRERSVADAPNRRPGNEAEITILRDGEKRTMKLKLMGATRDILADTIGEYILDNLIR